MCRNSPEESVFYHPGSTDIFPGVHLKAGKENSVAARGFRFPISGTRKPNCCA
jgi:hypothetical protein